MNRVEIDFGERRWPHWGLLVSGLFVLGFLLTAHFALERRIHHLAQQSAALVALRVSRAPPEPKKPAADPKTARRLAQIDRELSVPWDAFFHAVEASRMDADTILAIEPEIRTGRFRLVVQTVQYSEALAFVRRLSQQPLLHQVVLTSHQFDATNVGKAIRIVIEGSWQ